MHRPLRKPLLWRSYKNVNIHKGKCVTFTYYHLVNHLFLFYFFSEQQCYSHKTHLCCGINKHNYRHDNDDVDDANDGEAYINETGPLACSISAPNCCVWEQIGSDKSLTFIKKCCEHCCSSIPGECDHNCTSKSLIYIYICT